MNMKATTLRGLFLKKVLYGSCFLLLLFAAARSAAFVFVLGDSGISVVFPDKSFPDKLVGAAYSSSEAGGEKTDAHLFFGFFQPLEVASRDSHTIFKQWKKDRGAGSACFQALEMCEQRMG